MTLLCASDDFVQRTLAFVPGTLGKLLYVASLRQGTDQYSHWGLIRKYGDSAAQRTMQDAHRNLLREVLSTPLRDLLADARLAAGASGQSPLAFVRRLTEESQRLLPPGVGGASARHFTAVLQCLASLLLHEPPEGHRSS